MKYLGVPSMTLIDQAIEFAAKAHRGQKRKGTKIPYISHPYAVGMILQQAGCEEEIIISGILHDTLEDTKTTEEELLTLFGPAVLEIVKGCSEPDKGASWEERKQHTLDDLKDAPMSVRQVACADKLHNIRSIKSDLAKIGEEAWTRFKRGSESQRWYYTGLVESLGYTERFALLDQLQDEVDVVFGTPLENPEWQKLRRNKKFFDLAFRTAYLDPAKLEKLEPQLNQLGALEITQLVHTRSYPIHPSYEQSFDEMAEYLQERGIEFQSNSDSSKFLIGFSTALKHLLNLYPHEVFHHFKRNMKRRRL
ncbi:HD domain-containing protein [Cohnella sp.]|uniref:HD domain-containing protein n=1 Tax=Cohnella sp. TaxID=1883426 RepID=UPI003563FDA3